MSFNKWIIVIRKGGRGMLWQDSRDDGNNTQATSLHPLVNVSAIMFKKGTFV
jgi:hypothetical protein